MTLDKTYKDVPGTTIFDAEQSAKGYHLNQFCMSFMQAENRERYMADPGPTSASGRSPTRRSRRCSTSTSTPRSARAATSTSSPSSAPPSGCPSSRWRAR